MHEKTPTFRYEEPAAKRKGRRPKGLRAPRRPELMISQILEWADAHHARTGQWPSANSGWVHENHNENWTNINQALHLGIRGLPGDSSIAQLLSAHRGTRNKKRLPPLTIEQILRWADAHHGAVGDWPMAESGPVASDPGETWLGIEMALRNGLRGLPGGSSLPRLLSEHRGRKNRWNRPLHLERILAWADAHFRRTGNWPTAASGPIDESPGDNWHTIHQALVSGLRGLPGDSSLARLLAEHRGRRNHMDLPALSVEQILGWADAHFRRTGHWPAIDSGPIEDADGERWSAIDNALRVGFRGLPGGSSMARLLAEHRGRRNCAALPPLTVKQILDWADAHFRRTGRWPARHSGPIEDAPDEHWINIDAALRFGRRGLPGGSSLPRLLVKHRRKSPIR